AAHDQKRKRAEADGGRKGKLGHSLCLSRLEAPSRKEMRSAPTKAAWRWLDCVGDAVSEQDKSHRDLVPCC
ncbi:MAG TPA: hypothetical protein PKA88_23740, partial [Polyangiaceae bacterium]|nr:hypothetical protein [Polyangiaceae bacterium]